MMNKDSLSKIEKLIESLFYCEVVVNKNVIKATNEAMINWGE